MKNFLLQKLALVAVITAMLLIPLTMIEATICERTGFRAEAILCSEQNALLLGPQLLFFALAGLMPGTRHMDGYGLNKPAVLVSETAAVASESTGA